MLLREWSISENFKLSFFPTRGMISDIPNLHSRKTKKAQLGYLSNVFVGGVMKLPRVQLIYSFPFYFICYVFSIESTHSISNFE